MQHAFHHRLLIPSLADLFPAVVLLAEFGRPASWQALLGDGDTGWHIRTGDYILRNGQVPHLDLFSFSRAGEPWYAWEWLSDVIWSRLHHWGGLQAVAAFSAVVLCLSAGILFRWLLRRGAGLWIGTTVTLAVVSASTIHHLARPHIFSLLFFTLFLALLTEDRRDRRWTLWILPPLMVLWTNLHGGFVSWLATLGLLVIAETLARRWAAVRRYGLLAALCSAATLANPYGWQLHTHIIRYLGSSWIMDNVSEFQSPRFRSENMLVFAALLLAGTALASRAFARREWFEGALVLAWGFAALRSARHVPLYAVAAAPLIASECAAWWRNAAERRQGGSGWRTSWDVGRDLGNSCAFGPWAAVLLGLALLAAIPGGMADFPDRFPTLAVAKNAGLFQTPGAAPRVLTSDQWADYLIFRFYPRQRVFFDGRSDFYGPAVGADYEKLLAVAPGWSDVLSRYGFDLALLPLDWPLGAVLEKDPGWRVIYRDSTALLLERNKNALKVSGHPAECIGVSD